MKHHPIEQALYDLTLPIAGEPEMERLTRNVLQRLLYHTGFSAGLLLRPEQDSAEGIYASICAITWRTSLLNRCPHRSQAGLRGTHELA